MEVFFNGIGGVTGDYLTDPCRLAEVAEVAMGHRASPPVLRWLKLAWEAVKTPHLGLPITVDPRDPGQAGWGIVFSVLESIDVKAALEPLIEHRRRSIGERRTRVLEYRPGERWSEWLARHNVAPAAVDPERIPYYLLLVGPPDAIPFEFQYLLDVEYAVGRLCLDGADAYRCYAESLIEQEQDAARPRRGMTLFGPWHPSDPATELSSQLLVRPLGDHVSGVAIHSGHDATVLMADRATRSELLRTLCDRLEPPALLFTATHGLGWPSGHRAQESMQGALVCQDWQWGMPPALEHCVAGEDVPPDAVVHGLVWFTFACYGAGTPEYDDFPFKLRHQPDRIAPRPFVAGLPKRVLSHPGGAAIAMIGHIERAWSYSFKPPGVDPHLLLYRNTLGRILLGEPIGYAMKDFNELYASLSTGLANLQRIHDLRGQISKVDLVQMWAQRNDAQNYVVLGDPAARLRPVRK